MKRKEFKLYNTTFEAIPPKVSFLKPLRIFVTSLSIHLVLTMMSSKEREMIMEEVYLLGSHKKF